MTDFNKEDVIKVAKALVKCGIRFYNGDYGISRSICNFCESNSVNGIANIDHKEDCPVLIAQDLLTGLEG